MMFWVLAAILTALVTVALLWPLARGRAGAEGDSSNDVAVYGDQLGEVERDMRDGLIDRTEADYARAEIARRLLRADAERRTRDAPEFRKPGSKGLVQASRIAVLVFVPVFTMGAYIAGGKPGMPDQPLAARTTAPEGQPEIGTLVARAEAHLAENPDDGRGWEVLAPIYMATGELEKAREAYVNAIRILGPSAQRQSGYGEVLTALAEGDVTDEARVAFQSAREMSPSNPKAAFYLALAMEQDGERDRALDAFRSLAARSPADAAWMPAVNARIAKLNGTLPDMTASGLPPLTLPQTGAAADEAPSSMPLTGGREPSVEEMQAVLAMDPEERDAMVDSMVDGLDRRLQDNPDDIKGWIRLVRSYGVLGRADEARDALRRGLEIFPRDTDDGRALVTVAEQVGIATGEDKGATGGGS